MRELERERLLQDHHVHALTELRPQQRLTQRDAALCAGDRRNQQTFGCNEHERLTRQGEARGVLSLDRRDDSVDDQAPT